MSYRIHQVICLKANKKEGWPKEYGIYEGASGRGMCIVQVFEHFTRGLQDDGIREIETRFIRPITKKERRERTYAKDAPR